MKLPPRKYWLILLAWLVVATAISYTLGSTVGHVWQIAFIPVGMIGGGAIGVWVANND